MSIGISSSMRRHYARAAAKPPLALSVFASISRTTGWRRLAMADRVLLDEAGTFMGVPASRELSNSKAALLGIPFDCGVHPTRIGARLGPQSIRQHSGLVRRYEPPFRDFDPLARLGLVDCGNVRVRSSFIAEAFENIEAEVWEIVQAGAMP